MSAAEIVSEAEALGIELVADGPWLRVRPTSLLTPDLLERLRAHKAEILDLLTLRGWPEEFLDRVRETGTPIARFFPFKGRQVATPQGDGQLVAVTTERVCVVLNGSRRVSYFLPGEVRPPNVPPIAADVGATVH